MAERRESSPAPRSRPAPVIEAVAAERPPVPAWIAGAISALQGFLWSWLLLVIPAVAAFVAAAAQVTTQDSWRAAVGVASRIWILGHGGTSSVSGAQISLIPLGVTLVGVISCAIAARRSSRSTLTAWVSMIVAYTIIATLIGLVLGSSLPRLVAVSAGVAALGGLIGYRLGAELLERIAAPASVRTGLVGAAATLATVLGVGALLVMLWAFAGRSTSSDILTSLDPDTVGGIVLGIGQIGYLFTLVVWSAAWLSGSGFQVGDGSAFAPGTAALEPLPAVPLVSALPTGDMAASYTTWFTWFVVGAGVVGALAMWRRLKRPEAQEEGTLRQDARPESAAVTWQAAAITVAFALAAVAIAVALTTGLSSGSIGPGRLAHAGASWVDVTWRLTLLAGAGMAITIALVLPRPRQRVAELVRRLLAKASSG